MCNFSLLYRYQSHWDLITCVSTTQDSTFKKKYPKTKRLSQTRRNRENMTNKCSVVPWLGSWDRNRTLMELVNS